MSPKRKKPAIVRFLKQAGYEVRDQQLVNVKTGEPYAIEFLTEGSGFERVFLFYKPSLDRLGMRPQCGRSTRYNIKTGCAAGTSTPPCGHKHLHPATNYMAILGRGPPKNPAHATELESKTQRSTP